MNTVKKYLSLIKFSHTVFAMPFALIGFTLALRALRVITPVPSYAEGSFFNPEEGGGIRELLLKFLLVILCMIFARSAAMAYNRYLDRKFDALNPRTAVREIPKGIISPSSALSFTLISSALFVLSSFLINTLCGFLSPVALLVILGYSYTKRFTALCHLVLGLGLSLAPIGAYLAVSGEFHIIPILFSLAVLFWVSGFDIIYALQDTEFDQSQGLHSIPAKWGKEKALRISEILHLLSATAVIAAGRMGGFGLLYWIGIIIFGGCLIYQHSIVKPTDLRRVNLAFMTVNGIASIVFAIFVIADLALIP